MMIMIITKFTGWSWGV